MSAPYHNIEERVEDTIKAYLSGALTGATDALPIKVAFCIAMTPVAPMARTASAIITSTMV